MLKRREVGTALLPIKKDGFGISYRFNPSCRIYTDTACSPRRKHRRKILKDCLAPAVMLQQKGGNTLVRPQGCCPWTDTYGRAALSDSSSCCVLYTTFQGLALHHCCIFSPWFGRSNSAPLLSDSRRRNCLPVARACRTVELSTGRCFDGVAKSSS